MMLHDIFSMIAFSGLGLGLEGIKEINNLISLRNLMEQLGGKQQQRREVPAVVTETVQQEPITNTITKTQVVRVIPQSECHGNVVTLFNTMMLIRNVIPFFSGVIEAPLLQ